MDTVGEEAWDDSGEVSPLVASVSRRLISLILKSNAENGLGLPSERRLASQFEVSRGVIRAAIKKLASEGLLETKANCRPVVRGAQPTKTVARRHLSIWLWPNTSDFAAASIMKGIQRADLGGDVKLLVGNAPEGDWASIVESERRFIDSLVEDSQEACAILWYLGRERNLPALRKLRAAGVPVVFVDRLPPKGFAADFVGTNNQSAAEQAVKHLVDLGHRRVGFITNMDDVSSVLDRQAGYLRALRSVDVKPMPQWIQRDQVDDPVGVKEALDNLLECPEPPTAIFCINDLVALQVYEELEQRRIRIPEDISLVGFDGVLRWLPGGGYLTTVCQDFERIGQLAAELVFERIETGIPEAYTHYLLDAPLLNRNSTRRHSEARA